MKSGQRKYLKRCGLDIHVHNVQRRFESNADCPYIYIYITLPGNALIMLESWGVI